MEEEEKGEKKMKNLPRGIRKIMFNEGMKCNLCVKNLVIQYGSCERRQTLERKSKS